MSKRLSLPIKLGFLLATCLLCLLWECPSPAIARHNYGMNKFGPKGLNHDFITNRFAPTVKKIDSSALCMHPAVRQGLSLIIPSYLQKNLTFDAGYDRWAGLPTLTLDYFLPVKCWKDKSLFFSPRVSLTGVKENFSMCAGVRKLLNSKTMLGLYAFNDWTRQRRRKGEFLKEVGVGLEFSALPGHFSDLSIAMNAYVPVNQRWDLKKHGNVLVREMLPTGGDARIDFELPALTDYLDFHLDGEVHSYKSEDINRTGYRAGLNVRTRDGMLSGRIETDRDSQFGRSYRVQGNISLTFDWVALVNGENPFSAPYRAPDTRFTRNLRDSLYSRVQRNHNLPMDTCESKTTLVTQVTDNTVYVSGGFPHLPNEWVTLQTSQSPWKDAMEIKTNSKGGYSGSLELPPGVYRIRLVHKPSGRASKVKTIVIADKESE
jgi:hypothetical protein